MTSSTTRKPFVYPDTNENNVEEQSALSSHIEKLLQFVIVTPNPLIGKHQSAEEATELV